MTLRVAAMMALLAMPGCTEVEILVPDWTGEGDFDGPWGTGYAAEADFVRRVPAGSALTLTATAGSVEIVGSPDASEILVEGIRRVRSHDEADARRYLDGLAVQVWESDGTVFVETVQPSRSGGRSYQVEYRVTVPAATDVSARQAAGPVEVRSVVGNVEARTAAGSVTLRDLTGDVRASAATGTVDASVALRPEGVVELHNGTGDIRLSIPAGTSAMLWATTMSGAVRFVDVPIVDEDRRGSVVQGRLADGEGTIRLETVLGDITVKGS